MPEIKEEVIQNFVDLQDVLSNLALKIDDLTQQISKLLRIFEEAAKSFHNAPASEEGKDKEVHNTMKTLLDQNKIIAKGISIIEERTRNQPPLTYQTYPQYPRQQSPPPSRFMQNQPQSKMTPSVAPPRPSDVSDIKPKPKPLPK